MKHTKKAESPDNLINFFFRITIFPVKINIFIWLSINQGLITNKDIIYEKSHSIFYI
jgi:hypothetical protein